MIGQKLEEKIQFKIDKLLTDFVIKYNQDDDEERIDALHPRLMGSSVDTFRYWTPQTLGLPTSGRTKIRKFEMLTVEKTYVRLGLNYII